MGRPLGFFLFPSLTLILTSSFTPPSLLKQLPRYLKDCTSSKESPFSCMFSDNGPASLPAIITLLLSTFTLSFLLSHTLPNSLTSACNCSAESATKAVSSAKSNWLSTHSFPLSFLSFTPLPCVLLYTSLTTPSIYTLNSQGAMKYPCLKPTFT